MDCGLLIFENFDDIKDFNFNIFNIIGIDKSGNFLDQFNENFSYMFACKRQVDTDNRVILLKFDFLKFLLDSFIDGMGDSIFRQEQ